MTTNVIEKPDYNFDIVKLFTLATCFWGVVGMLGGVLIALQLAFPALNFEPYLNFGRLRPLHTSGVVFAFGGMPFLQPAIMWFNEPVRCACGVTSSPVLPSGGINLLL